MAANTSKMPNGLKWKVFIPENLAYKTQVF